MSQIIGEIKLFPYNDIPQGFLRCEGQSLHIRNYPKLYMLIGTQFGKEGEILFKLPDLREYEPKNLKYCIAVEGELPIIHN